MESMIINRRDLDFLLYDFIGVQELTRRDRFRDHTRETFDAAIETAHRIAADHFAPHNRKNDTHEPEFDGERVTVIPEVKTALDHFCRAGLMAAAHDMEDGGMQLPETVARACFALFNGANVATASYPFLTMAAANLIRAHGSEEQRKRYMLAMLEGRFFGTMALTEPQAGSGLADIKTKAVRAEDGSYRLTGNKIFISGGDHELSENIVHMVLARVEGAPAGTKGISLFIVPKFLVEDDGGLGKRNDVTLGGLIHKMGWRGTTSTMLNFGENGDCVGYLVGEENKGLAYMFAMMNEARIGVGLCAVMLGYTGYLHALDYARKRPQGRSPLEKDPTTPQIPIIGHADVRRMLLAQKAAVEGGLALCLYCARLVDERDTGEDEKSRAEAGLLLDILTPVAKAWPAEFCLAANDLAIQVHGGYGYTRDYPVEQFYRDNRLNPIHEGTNGIQAIDLLGRKVVMHKGAALKLLLGEMRATADAAARFPSLTALSDQLHDAVLTVVDTTRELASLLEQGDIERYLANASAYLDLLGHVVLAWTWLEQAVTAATKLEKIGGDDAEARSFLQGKIQTCRYFFAWELPRIKHWARILSDADPTCLDMKDDWF